MIPHYRLSLYRYKVQISLSDFKKSDLWLSFEVYGDTGLSKKEVKAVLDSLGKLIHAHVKPRSVGSFKLPGMMKNSSGEETSY